MSDSVLDRIRKNRQRSTVPPRSDSLLEGSKSQEKVHETDPQEVPKPENPIENTMVEEEPAPAPEPTTDPLQDLKAELAEIPETQRHSAIVLEKELDHHLSRYCKDNRITIEVFLEAAWVYANENPEALETIFTEAKRRYGDRKRAGKLRRLITMLEKQS